MADTGKGLNKKKARQQSKMKNRRLARRNAQVVEKNKVINILDHVARFPWDAGAVENLARLKAKMRGITELPPSARAELPKVAESPRQLRAKNGFTLTSWKKAGRPDLAAA